MMARSLVRNTLLYLPAQVLGPFVQFAVIIAWTHLLDPAAFGVVTFVIAAQELTALFGIVWWSLYVLRFRQRYEGADEERFRAMDVRMVLYGSLTQVAVAPFCLLAVGLVAEQHQHAVGQRPDTPVGEVLLEPTRPVDGGRDRAVRHLVEGQAPEEPEAQR